MNFNLRGSQYAIAGTVRGLEVLEDEVEKRREISGGKRSFILVPGIDVPFHSVGCCGSAWPTSAALAGAGHAARRRIPNPDHRPLHPQPGAAALHDGPRRSSQEIRDLVPAEPLDESPRRLRHLAERERPRELVQRTVLSSSCWPGNLRPARCAGSKPRICCSPRRPRAALVWSGSSRSASQSGRR